MDFKREDEYSILKQNEMAIANLTKIVEKTSKDVDKLVEKQTELLVSQEQFNVIKNDIDNLDIRIEKLENSQGWTVKSLVGAVITILVSIAIFAIKGK